MGNKLLEQVVQLSGLPEEEIREELLLCLKKEGIDPSKLTEPLLRKALASYLREIMLKLLRTP